MKIILKHTLSSIKKGFGQIIIMIITMVIITASIFVSLSVTDVFKKNADVTAENSTLNSDIGLFSDWIIKEKLDEFLEDSQEYIKEYTYSLETKATIKSSYDTTNIQILLNNADEILDMLETPILKEVKNTTEYPSIIISRILSEELEIDVGDTIDLSSIHYNGFESKMFVSKIVENSTYFYSVGDYRAMADYDEVISYLVDEEIPYNTVRFYLNTPDAPYPNDEEGRTIKEYLVDHFDYIMSDLYLPWFNSPLMWEVRANDAVEVYDDSIKNVQNSLNVAVAVIVLVMVFILYFSYSIIAKNRGEIIIRFKAAGATPSQTVGIMLVEVIFYAVIACTIGVFAGKLINDTVASTMLYSKSTLLTYQPWQYLVSVFAGIFTGIIACLIPAYKISRKSIRQLMTGDMLVSKRAPIYVPIMLTVLLGGCFALLFLLPEYALYSMIALVLVGCFWVVTITPYILKLFSKIMGKIATRREGKLATLGLHRNSGIATVTAMMSLMICFIWAGISIIGVVSTVNRDPNSSYTSDFIIEENTNLTYSEMEAKMNDFSSLDGLDHGVYYKDLFGRLVSEDEANKSIIENADFNAISSGEGIKYFTRDWDESLVESFNNTKRPVIISYKLSQTLGKEIGDTINVNILYRMEELPLEGEFTIVGIDHYYTADEDGCIFKIEDLVSGDTNFYNSHVLFAFSGDVDKFISLREKIDTVNTTIYRTSGYYITVGGSSDIYAMLDYISYFFYIVSAISLINLITITSIERKKEMETFRLVGLTSRGTFKMTFVEGVIISISGLIMGLTLAIAISNLQPIFCSLMGRYAMFEIFPKRMFVIAFIASIIGLLMWMLSPIFATTMIDHKNTKTIHSAD